MFLCALAHFQFPYFQLPKQFSQHYENTAKYKLLRVLYATVKCRACILTIHSATQYLQGCKRRYLTLLSHKHKIEAVQFPWIFNLRQKVRIEFMVAFNRFGWKSRKRFLKGKTSNKTLLASFLSHYKKFRCERFITYA